MTPWDMIVWALAASTALVIAGFGVALAVMLIRAAQRS